MAELVQESASEADTSPSKPNDENNEAESPEDAGEEEKYIHFV